MIIKRAIIMMNFDPYANIWAYVFLTINHSFLANQAQILYGDSGDYYLSIGVEKSELGHLFFNFGFLSPNLTQNRAWLHSQP